jgi:activating signal cointegrator complex subunit 3
MDPEEMHHIS